MSKYWLREFLAPHWVRARWRYATSSKTNVAFIVIVIGLIALIGLDLQRQLSVVLLRLATIALTLVQLQRLGTAPPVNTGARPRSRTRLVFSFTVVVIVLIAVLAAIGFIAG